MKSIESRFASTRECFTKRSDMPRGSALPYLLNRTPRSTSKRGRYQVLDHYLLIYDQELDDLAYRHLDSMKRTSLLIWSAVDWVHNISHSCTLPAVLPPMACPTFDSALIGCRVRLELYDLLQWLRIFHWCTHRLACVRTKEPVTPSK